MNMKIQVSGIFAILSGNHLLMLQKIRCPHLQGQEVLKERDQGRVNADFLNVKMKTLQLHNIPVTIYPTTQQSIPDLQQQHYKKLKFRTVQVSTSNHVFWPSCFIHF